MWIDDEILQRCAEPIVVDCFVPQKTMVVCGAANDVALEVNQELCNVDSVDVLRRYGGGGAVVLYPGCVVVRIGTWVQHPFQNSNYFKLLNQSVISALTQSNAVYAGLSQAGISDIVFGPQKIAGTSLFRSRNYLLYQASILINLELRLIDRYLRHPSREPEYRQGRSHAAFLQGLQDHVPDCEPVAICGALREHLPRTLRTMLATEILAPQQAQIQHILARAAAIGS